MLSKALLILAIIPFISAVNFPITPKFGLVPGIDDCGSTGAMHGVWLTECVHNPCRVIAGGEYTVAVEFTPATSAPSFLLEIFAIIIIPIPLLEETFEGPFDGGVRYRIEYDLTVPDMFVGQVITLRATVRTHFCVQLRISIIRGMEFIGEVPIAKNAKLIAA